jgi:F0F1-type ATP synthase membrane subunit b/b'
VNQGFGLGEIVNLRRARKQRRRDQDDAIAAANRLAHGLSKAAKRETRAERERAERALDGHRREPDGQEP